MIVYGSIKIDIVFSEVGQMVDFGSYYNGHMVTTVRLTYSLP